MTRVGAALLGTHWLVRAPIWIYRARLGFLFGRRLLMLEHLGRGSGRRRYVVLEIVDHPAAGSYVVISGFGTRAPTLLGHTATCVGAHSGRRYHRVWNRTADDRPRDHVMTTRPAGEAGLVLRVPRLAQPFPVEIGLPVLLGKGRR